MPEAMPTERHELRASRIPADDSVRLRLRRREAPPKRGWRRSGSGRVNRASLGHSREADFGLQPCAEPIHLACEMMLAVTGYMLECRIERCFGVLL